MDGAISCADHSREPSYSLLIFWIIYAPVGRSPRSQRGLCGGADGLHPAMARKERAMRLLKDFTGIGRRPASANSSDSHRSRPDSYRARRHRCTLGLERLEDRVALSTFVVTNLGDGGDGSLRQAIALSNSTPGPNEIAFAPGLSGTITLTSGELQITDDVRIVGPGAA